VRKAKTVSIEQGSGDPVTESAGPPTASARSECLHVSFRISQRDIRKSYFQALCQHPLRKHYVLAYLYILPIALGVIAGVIGSPLFGVGLAVGAWLVLRFYAPSALAQKAVRQHGVRNTQTLRISPENLIARVEGIAETKYEWGFVEGITDSQDYIAFHWKTGRSGIVPKRAFPDAESAVQFARSAAAWHAAATRAAKATGGEITPTTHAVEDVRREP
jgi:hypothetical protein